MDAQQKNSQWRRAAGRMASRLKIDLGNGRMLHDPWSRAAHSMVQGWRIRLSRPPAKGNRRVAPRPTWKTFAQRGVGVLAPKKNHAAKCQWKLWANRRVTAGSRYISKSKRTW